MLFNSFEFFLFLPVVLIVYFILNRQQKVRWAKVWLILASLFYYSFWKVIYLPLIVSSIVVNYNIGKIIRPNSKSNNRRLIFYIGLVFNVSLLAYFKYTDFFIENINYLLSTQFGLLYLTLPLAISFFTFQQIAYLVDSYRGETTEYDFLNYSLFVSFFPQLIAGPIVHHKEMMPQFSNLKNSIINYSNISKGFFVFTLGLFKKVVIADTFAVWASNGYANSEMIALFDAWVTSLSYSMQLYFDFSGYTDMAIGIALMFNIVLPINFNSPYKALNIQDFWRRWHITLSRFLRNYIYIPLGGNRKGEMNLYRNLLLTFLIGGIWHGAGWTFILWGALHGVALIIQRVWKKTGLRMHNLLAWFITFNFVNIAWVFFRAESFENAIHVLMGLFGFNGVVWPDFMKALLSLGNEYNFGVWLEKTDGNFQTIYWLIAVMLIAFLAKNSIELAEKFKTNWLTAICTGAMFAVVIFNMNKVREFLYFNF